MTDHTPLAQVRKKFRVKWYRSPIPRDQLSALMRRSNLRGAAQSVGHLALWAATGAITFYCFIQGWWIAFAVALFCHGTVGSFFRGLAVHELAHGTVFKTPALNRAFLYVYSLLSWWNHYEYAMSHTYHHRYTLHPQGDREVVLPRTPTLRFLCLLQLFTVNFTHFIECNAVYYTLKRIVLTAFNRYDNDWFAALYQDQPEARKRAVTWARLLLLFNAVVIVASFLIGYPILAVLICGHIFIANWLKYFVSLPMHCGLRSNVPDFRRCVRTITLNPIAEFLYWHMNWHTEHHMFAGVPCYNLAKLHQAVHEDMPAPRTLTGAWREMRHTWRRQLEDPDYEFDTPLPPTANQSPTDFTEATDADAQAIEASIGDLAPAPLA